MDHVDNLQLLQLLQHQERQSDSTGILGRRPLNVNVWEPLRTRYKGAI